MNDSTNPSIHNRCITRRTALSGLSVALVALAGCASTPSTGGETSTSGSEATTASTISQSDVFASVEFDGGQLVVEFASDTSVDWVYRFGPNGDLSEKARVPTGGTKAWFDLVGSNIEIYTPGTHRLAAIKNDEILDEVTLNLAPDVAFTDFRWAKNHPDMAWDKSVNNWETHAAFLLENTGSGPAILTQTQWRNAPFVLRTEREEQTFEQMVPLPPGETTTIYAIPSVYETSGGLVGASAVECENIDTKTLQLTTVVEPGANSSYSQTIEYGGEKGACELSIVDSKATNSTQAMVNGGEI